MTSNEKRHEARYQRRKAKREARQKERYGACDDFDEVFTFEHLYASARQCFRGVGWKGSTQRFRANTVLNVSKLHAQLHGGGYKTKGFHEFDIIERGKPRHIKSIHISERIVQRCLCDYSLVPLMERGLIYDSGACIRDKGVAFSVKRLKKHLRDYTKEHGTEGYVLRIDFSHYFDTVNHEKLKALIRSKYTDPRLIAMLEGLVDDFGGEEGLGLGSQISQICALAFPGRMDHMIKERHRMKFYGRYMDDAYILSSSKEELRSCLEDIRSFTRESGIMLNPGKTQIMKLKRGVPFLKRRFVPTETGRILQFPDPKGVTRMRRKIKTFNRKLAAGEMTEKAARASLEAWDSHMREMTADHARYTTLKLLKI